MEDVTPHKLLQLIGRLLWATFVHRVAVCRWPHLMSLMQRICVDLDNKTFLHSRVELDHHEKNDITALLRDVKTNTPTSVEALEFVLEKSKWIWTDASSRLGAWVIENNAEEEWHTHSFFDMHDVHIFYKELIMAHAGVLEACKRLSNAHILHVGDNTAVTLAIQKGHSLNKFANGLIREMYEAAHKAKNLLFSSWVSTNIMRADGLTRNHYPHIPGKKHPITLSLRDARH